MTKKELSDNVSDNVAKFAGSWKFFGAFLSGCATWVVVNRFMNFDGQDIYLNLVISIVTALLATIVLMHEHRRVVHDRKCSQEHMEMTRQVKALLEQQCQHKEDGAGHVPVP